MPPLQPPRSARSHRFRIACALAWIAVAVLARPNVRADDYWQPDSSFQPVFTVSGGAAATIGAFAVQPDGKVLVAGGFDHVNGGALGSSHNLVRLAADGTFDPSFSATLGATDLINRLLVQPDGKIVAIGSFRVNSVYQAYVRFAADGTQDASLHPPNASVFSIALDSAGYFYGLVTNPGGSTQFNRYTPDGDLDPTFTCAVTGVWQFAANDDGTVFVYGTASPYGFPLNYLQRLLHDGSVDSTFSIGQGSLPTDPFGLVSIPGGRVLTVGLISVGTYGSALCLARYGHDGTAEYTYYGQTINISLPRLGNQQALEIAGATFDALLASDVLPLAEVQASLSLSGLSSIDLDIRADGRLLYNVVNGLTIPTFASLERTSLTTPSVDPTPAILSQSYISSSGSAALNVGGFASLTAVVSGLSPFSFQWVKDGEQIAGATSSSYFIQSAQPTDAGAYTLIVTNGYGTVSTQPITLTIKLPSVTPSFTAQPQSQTVDVGANVTFTVAVSGTPTPTLQWQKDSVNIGGQTGTSLALTNVQTSDAGTYTVAATNSAGSATGNGAVLSVNVPATLPAFTTQPQGQTVEVGAAVTFTVAVSGTPTPTLQWQKDSVNIDGQTGTSLALTNIQASDAGTYTVVATNSAGSTTSNGAVLTVNVPATLPAFTTQPQSQSVSVGGNVMLTVAVSGSPRPALQWFKDDSVLAGKTGATLSLVDVQLSTAGTYTVVATNSAGTATSSAAVLTVNAPASDPVVTTQPQPQTVAAGGNLALTSAVSGTPTPTLQWQRNGTDMDGATSSVLALNNLGPADAGLYSVVATSTAGTTTSSWAIVGVSTTSGAIGDGTVVATSVVHPNGNHYDQVLLTGAAGAISTQGGRVTRTSFIDLNDDIVQVEFSGAGTLSLVLDDPSGPATPLNYNQPSVSYMKGHVGLVIAGADETTNILVFTVGRATAFDPTGHYNILLPASDTNDPATNGSPLFVGHDATNYDGVADIAFIAIASTDGKFGGLRTSDARYWASAGLTGVYAPGVQFVGPVYLGNIDAMSANATASIIIGSTSDARITGGNLAQDNGQPVQVSGLTQLQFTAGSDSGGNILPAQDNAAVFEQNGEDVTAQIVVNLTP